MQQTAVVDRYIAGFELDGDHRVGLKAGVGNRPGAGVALVVAVHRTAMRTGDDEQAAVFPVHVVQRYADGEHVVVAAGRKGVVLMPFDRTAESRALHIELAAEVADRRTD